MSRPLRIQYPGAIYHVMCRGNERRDIFRDDDDRLAFLSFLARSLEIYSVNLHFYVLMSDHFHLLVEAELGNLAEFMRHFNISYTSFFNRKHKRVGHLYQGRYKSILVEKETYLSMLSRYIHLNPIRIKFMENLSPEEKFQNLCQYPWSSLPGYLAEDRQQPMVDYSLVLTEFGETPIEATSRYRKQILFDIDDNLDVKDKVFGQSILGSEDFISRMTRTFLAPSQVREQPSARWIKQYRQQDVIFATIEKETGKTLVNLKTEKGDLRRMTMDLLYRHGGLKGPAIGALFGVDYSAVSQERKRLRERLVGKTNLRLLMERLEGALST